MGSLRHIDDGVSVGKTGSNKLTKSQISTCTWYKLRGHASEAGIEYLQLEHWGVENFFSLRALQQASERTSGLTVSNDARLDPMKSLKNTDGVDGFSKRYHVEAIAQYASREELQSQPDFMRLIEIIKKSRRVQQDETTASPGAAQA